MDEQQPAPPEPAKKKGKLPVIAVLALVLASGGFFATKMRGGPAKKPVIELGTTAEIKDEFLVPLMGESSYLRANISLRLAKGANDKLVEEEIGAIRDAIIMTIKSKWLKEIQTIEQIKELKAQIAEAVNKVIEESEPKGSKKEPAKAKVGSPANPDWDSQTGPVLKVYFTTFATQ